MTNAEQELPRTRKRNKDGQMMVEFLVRIPEDLYEQMEERRKAESTSKAAVVRAALRRYL